MAKRRSRGRIAESTASYKLRKRQRQARKVWAPKPAKRKEMSPFEKKAIEIARLAINVDKKLEYQGSGTFGTLLGTIKIIRQFEEISESKKRRDEILRFFAGEKGLARTIAIINRWLEREGRPELKFSVNEVIDIILA